jgi:eukaryotic-like serine/threonine-protein kinase
MTDPDERLATVLDELLDSCHDEAFDQRLEAAVVAYPDLEDDLRKLTTMARMADELAESDSGALNAVIDGAAPTIPSGSQPGAATVQEAGRTGVGTRIGDYELIKQVGRGGMGVVYRARQTSLRRDVALKMIPNAEFASSDDLARLRLEALAAGQLSHPNVVPV